MAIKTLVMIGELLYFNFFGKIETAR